MQIRKKERGIERTTEPGESGRGMGAFTSRYKRVDQDGEGKGMERRERKKTERYPCENRNRRDVFLGLKNTTILIDEGQNEKKIGKSSFKMLSGGGGIQERVKQVWGKWKISLEP